MRRPRSRVDCRLETFALGFSRHDVRPQERADGVKGTTGLSGERGLLDDLPCQETRRCDESFSGSMDKDQRR